MRLSTSGYNELLIPDPPSLFLSHVLSAKVFGRMDRVEENPNTMNADKIYKAD